MVTAKQQAVVLGRLRRRLELVDYFEKVRRQEELWRLNEQFKQRVGQLEHDPVEEWLEAYQAVDACKVDDLIFEAVMAGASKAGVGRVFGKSGEAIAHVVTKVAARRYFALLRGKKRGAKPVLRVVGGAA